MPELAKCPLCSHLVSTAARACPNCGDILKTARVQPVALTGAVTTGFYLSLGFMAFGVFLMILGMLGMMALAMLGIGAGVAGSM